MVSRPPSIDDSVLSAARQGSSRALGRLLENCRSYLLLQAATQLSERIRSKIAPSDVVQQTFLEVRQGFSRFDGSTPEDFLAWIRQILENNIIDEHRRFEQTKQRLVDREQGIPAGESWNGHDILVDSAPTPHSEAVTREETELVDRAISQLPLDFQEVLRLRYRDELTFEQIGERIGRSAEATRKLWSRAIMRMRRHLPRSKS